METQAGTGSTPAAAGPVGADGTTALYDQIAAMEIPELVRRYRASVAVVDPRVFALSDEQLDQAFLPEAGCGRWPVRVLLGHLADAETVLTHRIRRAIAQPGAAIEYWDEDAFIDAGMYAGGGERDPASVPPPVGAFVGTVYTIRQWMGEWLASLRPEAWTRSVLHPDTGPMSVRDIVDYQTWHLEHHAGFLAAKVTRFLGEMPAGGCAPGGCGHAGCACVPPEAQSESGPASGPDAGLGSASEPANGQG